MSMDFKNKKKNVFMFSGQGSHYYNMGKLLYNSNDIFRKWMQLQDEAVMKVIGESVLEKMYQDRGSVTDEFNRTLYTHPAIFMIGYAMAKTLIELGVSCDYVLGTSLGEYIAAAVAGIINYEIGLKMVIKQARIIEENCNPGGMLAVMAEPHLYEESPVFYENLTLAGINYASHFIVSGDNIALDELEKYLKANKKLYQRLSVSHAFHSYLINPAEDKYLSFIDNISFNAADIPVISCCTTGLQNEYDKQLFWDIVRNPICFSDTMIKFQEFNGSYENYNFIDSGPAGTLATFIKYLLGGQIPGENIFSILTPFNQDLNNLKKIIENI